MARMIEEGRTMADCKQLASAQHELVEAQNKLDDAAKLSDLLLRSEPQRLSNLLVTPNIYERSFGSHQTIYL
jgi:hypothetical protein